MWSHDISQKDKSTNTPSLSLTTLHSRSDKVGRVRTRTATASQEHARR